VLCCGHACPPHRVVRVVPVLAVRSGLRWVGRVAAYTGLLLAVLAPRAGAQPPAPAAPSPSALPAASDVRLGAAARQERLGPTHIRYSGAVELELVSQGVRLSADVVDYYLDRHHLTATTNVVFVTPSVRIAADRAEIDTQARTGTFHHAFGSASVSDRVDRSFFGAQEPDAFFYGETIEKLGPDRYRVRKGGFTTCLQPTPRWEMTAGSVTFTLDKRAVLTHAVLKVKDVPLFYVPAVYFPINKEDRSTGFLLPIYGTSLVRGHTVSNAFFWAVDRSQDVTLMHDWFSKSGQGYGGEYRYVASSTSSGQLRVYRLAERATTYRQDGVDVPVAATNSLDLRGGIVQALPGGFRARGSVDFTTDLAARQRYQQDVYSATTPIRSYQGNVSGSLGRGNAISATYGVSEVFYGTDDSWTTGSRPRVQFTRALTRLGRLPVYVAASTEYAGIARFNTLDGVRATDQSLTRLNAAPSIQVPFTKWPFLSVRSSVTWYHTYWTESLVDGARTDEPFHRQYADLRSTFTGPVLSRVFDPSGSADGARFKHVIEPEIVVQHTTGFEGRERIVQIESGDYVYGGTSSVTYGVTNRLLVRRGGGAAGAPAAAGRAAGTRDVLTVQLQQTRYSDRLAGTIDPRYSGGFTERPGALFSPIALAVRANPTEKAGVTLRAEYDAKRGLLETLQLTGNVAAGPWVSASGGWSRSLYVANVLDPTMVTPRNYLRSQSNVTFRRSQVGGSYAFDLNLSDRTLVQQRIGLFYNAQCCGVALDYQTFNYGASTVVAVKQDRRFNISFTLAGLGSFSNVLGAFGIGQGVTGTSLGR
jgi:LPS-assembly protein